MLSTHLIVHHLGNTCVLSYQLAVPLSNPDRAFVRYRIDAGDGFNGENGLVSSRGFDSATHCAYGAAESWAIEDGSSLQFLFGLGTDPARADSDDDGLLDSFELANGMDPNRADMDSDGIPDGWELDHDLDPNDPFDLGLPPPVENCRALAFNIAGDYAAWEMTIEGQGPTDWRVMHITMGAPSLAGESETKYLRKR